MHVYNLEIINIVLSFALYQDSRMWNNEESFLLDVVLDIKDFVALTFCKTINYNYNCSPGGITEKASDNRLIIRGYFFCIKGLRD